MSFCDELAHFCVTKRVQIHQVQFSLEWGLLHVRAAMGKKFAGKARWPIGFILAVPILFRNPSLYNIAPNPEESVSVHQNGESTCTFILLLDLSISLSGEKSCVSKTSLNFEAELTCFVPSIGAHG